VSRWARMLGVTLGRVALVWASTWRLRLDVGALDDAMAQGPVIVAILHGELLPAGLLARGRSMLPMVSQSKDGEIIAGALSVFGFPLVRGGSSRGGAEALVRAEEGLRSGLSPVLAVDGPRGPAGVPKPGAVRLAVGTRRPIVVVRVQPEPGLARAELGSVHGALALRDAAGLGDPPRPAARGPWEARPRRAHRRADAVPTKMTCYLETRGGAFEPRHLGGGAAARS
jgi:lysophospholipid acyltransferase (LPLAT)-like uncharacterized protein